MTATIGVRIDRVADKIIAVAGWRRALLSLVLGALLTTAFAPLHLLPVLLLSLCGLLLLLEGARRRRTAFWTGWWFGFGHFVTGFYWIGEAFFVDAERFAWLSPAPVIGLPAAMALYFGLIGLIYRLVSPAGWFKVVTLAILWSAAELGRAYLFTGFPWNLIGYSWIISLRVSQAAAWVGVYGLGFLTVLIAASPVMLLQRHRQPAPVLVCLAIGLGIWGAGSLRLSGAEVAYHPDLLFRIVQGNIPQTEKFKRGYRAEHFRRYQAISLEPGADRVTHFIWPETAVEFFLESDPEVRASLAAILADGDADRAVLTGAPRRTPDGTQPLQYWNSFFAVNGQANVVADYDKVHLVPFGEYLPLRPLLSILGLSKLVHGAVDFSAGTSRDLMRLPNTPAFLVAICYEAIFPEEMAATNGDRPDWILNATNDAWFGDQAGPYQHFAMVRMRAIEQGIPVLRAANTGISGIVNQYGMVEKSIGLNMSGKLDVKLPIPEENTIYSRFGMFPFFATIAFFLLVYFAFYSTRKA